MKGRFRLQGYPIRPHRLRKPFVGTKPRVHTPSLWDWLLVCLTWRRSMGCWASCYELSYPHRRRLPWRLCLPSQLFLWLERVSLLLQGHVLSLRLLTNSQVL